jgi:signal transduction histidine kinase
MPATSALAQEYAAALREYLRGDGERALEQAYKLGRRALSEGVGVLELAGLYEQALARRLAHCRNAAECASTVERGARFLLESLSPFEMTHRGFRETNNALRFLNDNLEQRVVERTTEAEAARQLAEEANRAKSDFLAVMSHELRTPLNAVLGYTDLLDAGISGPLTDKQKEHVVRIRSSARHLLELIEEILAFAKIESGRDEVKIQRVELSGLVQEAAALIEPAAAERGLELRLVLPEPEVFMETDPRKLRQILINLLSNAVKFTERGGILLGVAVRDDTVTLRAVDTGIGIPAEHLEHIFDSFWQVERSNTRRIGGTGLGLSVARSLARSLGGDLTVRSTPGKGSCFEVTLPVSFPGLD